MDRMHVNYTTIKPEGEAVSTRIPLWDNIRFILIMLVVIGHYADEFKSVNEAFKSVYLFIYAFHMPLYLFISGLFYSKVQEKQKILYYLSLGFFLKIVLVAIERLNGEISPVFSLLSDAKTPWYMFVLAEYTVIMHYMAGLNKRYILIAFLVLGCVLGYDKNIGDTLYLSRIIVFFPFFLLGTMVNKEALFSFRKKYYPVLLPIALAVLGVWAYMSFFRLDKYYICRHLLTGRNPFNSKVIEFGPLARGQCYFLSFLTGSAVIILAPGKQIPLITGWGKKTINVYFWHMPFYLLINKFFDLKHAVDFNGGGFVVVLFAVAVCILFSADRLLIIPLQTIKKACFYLPLRGSEAFQLNRNGTIRK